MMQLSEKTGIKQNVLQEIIRLAKENDVKKLILFGSRARGDYKERSDIDLAFYGELVLDRLFRDRRSASRNRDRASDGVLYLPVL